MTTSIQKREGRGHFRPTMTGQGGVSFLWAWKSSLPRWHHVDVKPLLAIGDKRQPAVLGPGGEVVDGGILGLVSRVLAIRVHRVDLQVAIPVAGEGEPLAIGGPAGVVVHSGTFR